MLYEHDDLPEFAYLKTDEDRERKAITQRPGTFSVVATPESFYDLPEYASAARSDHRRSSSNSTRGGRGSPRMDLMRSRILSDPNTILLDQFEEPSPLPFGSMTMSSASGSRRNSIPEIPGQTAITTVSYAPSTPYSPPAPARLPDELLLAHFHQSIGPRLIQPQHHGSSPGSTQDVLGMEAVRFAPLHHAICAVSALELAYHGRASMEESMQHYHRALAAPSTATSPNDLMLDGVFLRHFLLLIYDMSIPIQAGDDGTESLWAGHLNHLRLIAIQRHQSRGREPYGNFLWTIFQLDMYAGLMGSGNCGFVQTIVSHNMLPPLNQQIPALSAGQTAEMIGYLPEEALVFPAVLHLNEGIVLRTAKIAQVAQSFRSENTEQCPASPGTYARWQATAMQLQAEMHAFWQQAYPDHLGPELQASSGLPSRVRAVFENVSHLGNACKDHSLTLLLIQALLLYHAATIYARTSMFTRQRHIPTAAQHEVANDTERRVRLILAMAAQQVESGHLERRKTVFPIFMAGFATFSSDSKLHAIDLIRAFEGKGIGQNTYRTRQLLVAVCEEQRKAINAGRQMEDVEWMAVAREQGLNVVNCGL